MRALGERPYGHAAAGIPNPYSLIPNPSFPWFLVPGSFGYSYCLSFPYLPDTQALTAWISPAGLYSTSSHPASEVCP